jgi:transposase-like protein
MLPQLSNTELLLLLLTLWLLWFYGDIWWQMSRETPEETRKKKRRKLKPQTPDDCELCRLGVHKPRQRIFRKVTPWSDVKNASGRKKESNSEGRACPQRCCVYYGITDMRLHALVSNGWWDGKTERIRQWKCQACGCRFTDRRNTPLYRLKTASAQVAQALTAMAEGVDLSAMTRIFPFHHTTFSRWLAQAGEHGRELHEVTFRDFICEHLQLDELMTRVKKDGERVWLWTAVAAQCKVLLEIHVGGRKKQDAQSFIHRVKERLAEGCLPVFTSDGLRMYFYALTAHFGSWHRPIGARKDHWRVDKNLLYGQFRKVRKGFRIANIYTVVQWGERQVIKARLQAIGLSGKIQTAFVERLNLTLRELTAPLSRRTWSMAYDRKHLMLHVEWVRSYYHFARPHMALKRVYANGRKQYLTPAVAAGVAKRRYGVRELLLIALYPEPG